MSRLETSAEAPRPERILAAPLQAEKTHCQEAPVGRAIFVDAHVHLHPCFDVPSFLNHAAQNVRLAAAQWGIRSGEIGCLMLTESREVDRFENLRRRNAADLGDWELRTTAEACSLIADRHAAAGGTDRLILIAGRQIATAERLEVLALATREQFPDGISIRDTIGRVLDCGAVCVLPWGFGKWTGRRGRLIEDLIQSDLADQVFLGDNAGRLIYSLRPRHFKMAKAKGVILLPGTDPFPWRRDVSKPGAYGFVLRGDVDLNAPARQLKNFLSQLDSQPPTYGKRSGLFSFLASQAFIQLSRRRVRARAASK
jgi:hypothetical protein